MIVVVVDTGVYVSALVFGGIPQVAVAQAMKPPYNLGVSAEIQAELTETLCTKFGWAAEHVEEAGKRLWTNALWCKPANVKASRDPDDDHVLGCAVAGNAQFLISGDKDLLTLHPYGAVAIVTPAQFLEMHATAAKEDDNTEL